MNLCSMHIKRNISWCIIALIGLFLKSGDCDIGCRPVTEYSYKCTSFVRNTTILTTAIIQYCDIPPTATFKVDVSKRSISFEHTFTNDDETVAVTGWKEFKLHVQLTSTDPKMLKIRAVYIVDGKDQGYLIDRQVVIDRQDCSTLSYGGAGNMSEAGKIVIAIVVLILVVGVFTALAILYRRNQICVSKPLLVELMEGADTSEPYQEGPSESSLRVEYRANRNAQRTFGKDEIIVNPNAQSTESLDARPGTSTDGVASISRPRPKARKSNNEAAASSAAASGGAIPKVRTPQKSVTIQA